NQALPRRRASLHSRRALDVLPPHLARRPRAPAPPGAVARRRQPPPPARPDLLRGRLPRLPAHHLRVLPPQRPYRPADRRTPARVRLPPAGREQLPPAARSRRRAHALAAGPHTG